MTKLKIILILVTFFVSLQSEAQDPHFSQFYANQIYLNPAFAGTSVCPKININYRNQWPAMDMPFTTYSISYDQYADAIDGGFAFQLMNDNAGNTINTLQISGVYAYKFNLSRTTTGSFALQGTYHNQSINATDLVYPDMIDPLQGIINPTSEITAFPATHAVDVSAGFLLGGKKYYGGVAVHHIKQFLLAGDNIIKPKITAHVGANYLIKKIEYDKNPASFSPNITFQMQDQFMSLNYGFYYSKDAYTFGTWFRQNLSLSYDAFIVLFGMDFSKVKIAYEISLIYQLDCIEKNSRVGTISCPKF